MLSKEMHLLLVETHMSCIVWHSALGGPNSAADLWWAVLRSHRHCTHTHIRSHCFEMPARHRVAPQQPTRLLGVPDVSEVPIAAHEGTVCIGRQRQGLEEPAGARRAGAGAARMAGVRVALCLAHRSRTPQSSGCCRAGTARSCRPLPPGRPPLQASGRSQPPAASHRRTLPNRAPSPSPSRSLRSLPRPRPAQPPTAPSESAADPPPLRRTREERPCHGAVEVDPLDRLTDIRRERSNRDRRRRGRRRPHHSK